MAAEARWPGCGRTAWMRASKAASVPRRASVESAPIRSAARTSRRASSTASAVERGHRLGAVDQRQPFARRQAERLEAGARQRRGARRCARPADQASPRPSSGSARWASGARSPEAPTEPRDGTTGCTPAVEQLEQALEQRLAHARVAARQGVGAQQQHAAHLVLGERLAHAGGVREHQPLLQGLEVRGVDADVGEVAEAGVDAVDRLAARHRRSITSRAARTRPRAPWSSSTGRRSSDHRGEALEVQRESVDGIARLPGQHIGPLPHSHSMVRRRLRGDVVDDAVDAAHFVDDAVRRRGRAARGAAWLQSAVMKSWVSTARSATTFS